MAAGFRLIVDAARDGAANMALDEALLEAAADDPGRPPVLRLYGWRPAALSLGRTQQAEGAYDGAFLRREGLDLVRRPTGGQAVLHEHERTYALVAPLGTAPFPGGVLATYRLVAEALRDALQSLGLAGVGLSEGRAAQRSPGRATPVVCFSSASAHEVTVGGLKLVGSAQCRRRRAFLQHGSIPLRLDADRLARATARPEAPTGFTDLERAAGRPIAEGELDAAIARAFRERLGAEPMRGGFLAVEELRAAELRCWKYDSAAWTLAGRVGDRERRWGPRIA